MTGQGHRAGDRERLGLLQTFLATTAGVGNNFCFQLLGALPVAEIIVLRSGGALVLILAFFAGSGLTRRLRGRAAVPSLAWNRWVAVRALCEAGATGFLIVAVTHLPIALVTGVLMTVPLLVAVLGKAILGEQASRGIWIAIGIGFAGTLLLLRPGLDFSPLGLTSAGLSALCFAGRDVLTRHLPRPSGALRMTLTANTATLTLGLALSLVQPWHAPSQNQMLVVAAGVLLYVASNVLIALGIANARLAVTGPMRYASVPTALLLDALVHGYYPDTVALLAIALIVASGLAMSVLSRRSDAASA